MNVLSTTENGFKSPVKLIVMKCGPTISNMSHNTYSLLEKNSAIFIRVAVSLDYSIIFRSYCMDHRPVQVISTPVLEDSLKSVNNCAICFETMEPWPNINTLWAPCCSVNSWFHRNCIQVFIEIV